jgi:hypothetical protein
MLFDLRQSFPPPPCSVIRLFGRITALKNILTALTASIVPVLNAFLIMLVIAAICEQKSSPDAHSAS